MEHAEHAEKFPFPRLSRVPQIIFLVNEKRPSLLQLGRFIVLVLFSSGLLAQQTGQTVHEVFPAHWLGEINIRLFFYFR